MMAAIGEEVHRMEFDYATTLGLAAGILSTIGWLPQVIKTWKTRSADDLSWGMLITLCIGITLWLSYGIVIHDFPIIIANVVTFSLAAIILILKLQFNKNLN
jgi:MtN3 and saliva related transmembrane protein